MRKQTLWLVAIIIMLVVLLGIGGSIFLVRWFVKAKHFASSAELMTYAYQGDDRNVSLLLAQGINVNGKLDDNSPSALFSAALGHHPSTVRLLLKAGADPNLDRISPLGCAIKAKDIDSVQALLEHGARINNNCLLAAARSKNMPITRLLLSAGGNPNEFLTCAAYTDDAALVRLVLHSNAKHGFSTSTINAALATAKRRGNTDIVRILAHYRDHGTVQ